MNNLLRIKRQNPTTVERITKTKGSRVGRRLGCLFYLPFLGRLLFSLSDQHLAGSLTVTSSSPSLPRFISLTQSNLSSLAVKRTEIETHNPVLTETLAPLRSADRPRLAEYTHTDMTSQFPSQVWLDVVGYLIWNRKI